MKTCSKCKVEKECGEFCRSVNTKDGLQARCRECEREYRNSNSENISNRKREYYKNNIKKFAERKRQYYENNKVIISESSRNYWIENRDRLRIRNKEYRIANAEKIYEYAKANAEKIADRAKVWRESNRDKAAATRAEYLKKNPEKRLVWLRNRRSRKLSAEGTHTAADVRTIFDNQRGLCSNCQTKLFKSGAKKYHVDHIMPLARGGSNDKYNLQCLCPSCNLKKNAKDPVDWAQENGRLI